MAKRLIPSLNRVLIEKILPPTKTNTGILLPEKVAKVLSTFQFYTMRVNLFFFLGGDLTVVIGVIGVCSWTQGKWLQWDLEHVIELEIWYLWVWRRVTMFFCLSLGVPKSSLVKKSMFFFFYLLCSVLVSLNLFSSFFFLCCCMLIYIYIVFWVLVCGFCFAGSFCTGMRISWALFMTDWFLAFNGILFLG